MLLVVVGVGRVVEGCGEQGSWEQVQERRRGAGAPDRPEPSGQGRKRWTMRWKAPLNAFQIAFDGRLTPTGN